MIKLASFSINTKTDINKCFQYLSDMNNFKEWFPEVIQIEEATKGQIKEGKEYIETVKITGRGVQKVTIVVATHKPPMLFVTEGKLSPIKPRMEIELSSNEKGVTKIDWRFLSRNESLVFKLILPVVRKVMSKRAAIAADRLATQLVLAK